MCPMQLNKVSDGKFSGHLRIHAPREDSAAANVLCPVGIVENGDGPTALLIGTVHGDEVVGSVAISKIFHDINPANIKGKVIVCPTANINAVDNNQRFSPRDGKNMNRFFPGVSGGTVTESLCHEITKDLITQADFVVDFHSGGRSLQYIPGGLLRISCNEAINRASWKLAEAFGASVTYLTASSDRLPSHTSAVALQQSKPSMAMEISGGESLHLSDVRIAEEGALNVLRSQGILREDMVERETMPIIVDDRKAVYASQDGIFVPEVDVGADVDVGIVLARIYNYRSLADQPQILVSDHKALVVSKRMVANTRAGDLLIQLGFDGKGLVKSGFRETIYYNIC